MLYKSHLGNNPVGTADDKTTFVNQLVKHFLSEGQAIFCSVEWHSNVTLFFISTFQRSSTCKSYPAFTLCETHLAEACTWLNGERNNEFGSCRNLTPIVATPREVLQSICPTTTCDCTSPDDSSDFGVGDKVNLISNLAI